MNSNRLIILFLKTFILKHYKTNYWYRKSIIQLFSNSVRQKQLLFDNFIFNSLIFAKYTVLIDKLHN